MTRDWDVSRWGGVIAFCVGAGALAGWVLDIGVLKSILPGWVEMKANTAVAFVLTGVALLTLSRAQSSDQSRLSRAMTLLGRLCGAFAGLVGLLSLSEYVFEWSPGVDMWLFIEPPGAVGTTHPGRMAPDTALCFALLAVALELLRRPRRSKWSLVTSATLGVVVMAVAASAILLYLTPALGSLGWWGFTMMAAPTAIVFATLGASITLSAWRNEVSIWSLGRTPSIAFLCGLALLLLIGLNTSRSVARLSEADRFITRVADIHQTTALAMAELASAQTHTRGYVITGEARYIQSQREAIEHCRNALVELRHLAAGNPRDEEYCSLLEARTNKAIEWFSHAGALERTNLSDDDRRELLEQGEDRMERLRLMIARRGLEDRRPLQLHRLEAMRAARLAHAVSFAGTSVGVIIFLSVLFALNRAFDERKRAEQAAHDSLAEYIKAEESTRESEERFRSLFENMRNGLAYCRMVFEGDEPRDFIYLEVNNTFEALTGLKDVIGKRVSELVPGIREADPELFEIYGRVARTGEPRTFETYVASLDMWFAISAYSPGPEHFVAVFDVITERKRAEIALEQLNATLEEQIAQRTAQLEATNKELQAFSYSVSHDLRAPLRGIDGWSHALLEDFGDQISEEARNHLDRIRSEIQRMGALIDDMLALSRLTVASLHKEEVDLSAMARSIAARLSEREPQRRAEFVIEDGLTAFCDRHFLDVALENLLENAFKFTGKTPNARIEFGKIEALGKRSFFVRDNGAGFDMAHATRLFSAFQRLHKASEFSGTGVGLATVERVIQRHGGRVWAEAAPNSGATFYFTLEENQ